ncbi:nucleoside hydrolase [candidate division KSB1 bacterium]|nr:nucleoside hydrolase [candidate division KSB1 bacterium]
MKVLLDTDIGSDIDDAICLSYLLAHPGCDLLGITTVTGQALKRCQLASAICKAFGREVPIYPGVERPLIIDPQQPKAQQAQMLPELDYDKAFVQNHALVFLQDTIRRYPNEIVLLAIGPLTNIALLFAMDPELPSLLKGLVMMCGVFTGEQQQETPLEWNAKLDPHATAIVYGQKMDMHRSIGLDVTMQVRMDIADFCRFFKDPRLGPVDKMLDVWARESRVITFHDPLAAATLFMPDLCTFKQGTVSVDLQAGETLGKTSWQPGTDWHQIAVNVNSALFFDHFFRFFKKGDDDIGSEYETKKQ